MASTSVVTATTTDWTAAATGSATVLLEMTSLGVVLVHVAAAKPDAGVDVGVRMTEEKPFSATGLTDNVYVKALNTSENITVIKS